MTYLTTLTAWRATALRIVTAPGEYTASQVATAWQFLKQHGAQP